MKLHDPNFLTFDGEPITGITPPRLLVYGNDGVLTNGQQLGVRHAYKMFRDELRLSLGSYLVRNRQLEDGTLIRMVSNNGLDQVEVWPTGGGSAPRYAMLPAFWYNAPLTSQALPAEIHSGTWAGIPIKASGTGTKAKEKFWKVHPGNRTWRDARTEAPSKGLVLSWWGTGKDRYSDWVHPSTTVEPAFNKLYCNGVLIWETDPAYGIAGAGIRQTDSGKLQIVVAIVFLSQFTSFYQKKTTRYGTPGGGIIDALWWTGYLTGGMFVNFYGAEVPAGFKDGRFKKIPFNFIGGQGLSTTAGTFTIDGAQYYFATNGAPQFHATSGLTFNESGTEAFLRVYSSQIWAMDGSSRPLLYGLKFDTSTGKTSSAVWDNTSVPGDRFMLPLLGADYEGDTLVYAGVRASGTNVYLWHSKYGKLCDVIASTSFAQNVDYWHMTGDMRVALMHFIHMDLDQFSGAFTGFRLLTFKAATLVETRTGVATPSGHNSFDYLSDGNEGADSSFDGRLIVDRFWGDTRAYIDGVDVTAALDDANKASIKYPVLCGPIQLPQGTHRSIKQLVKYVA